MARKRAPARKPPPKCKAILLCDQAIIDARTGKISIIGIFERFNIPVYPAHTSRFMVYLQLTDGIGAYQVTMEVHDLGSNSLVARAVGPVVEFPERFIKANILIDVPPMKLRHPGAYDFVVLADGQEIDRQQFLAPGPDPGAPEDEANDSPKPSEEG